METQSTLAARNRIASHLLLLFALIWLAAIYGAGLFGHPYSIDAILKPRGADAVVVTAAPAVERLGLRPGTTLLLSRMSYADAVRVKGSAQYGMLLSIIINDGSHIQQIVVPATKPRVVTPPLETLFDLLTITFSLLLAGYLGYRKPGIMTAALVVFLGGGDLSWPAFAVFFAHLPDTVFSPLAAILADLCNWFPVLALASFAVRLPGDEPRGRKRVAVAVVDAIVTLGFVCGLFPQPMPVYVFFTGLSGVVLLCASFAALHYAQPSDRGRVGIVFAGVMIGGVGYAVNMIGLRYGEPLWLFLPYATLSVIIVPLSVAYAILRHRVFDIGFVLNRTIVYAVTSAVVLLVFAALEFATERILSDLTHVEGVVLQFAIALLVIVSVRLVHGRVDGLVDSVLFRSRHEQESALRRFATTLQFYTEETALIRDTVDALGRYALVQGAALYVARAGLDLELAQSSFCVAAPAIDLNDTAYVELRAHHEALHVHGKPTAFPGERLYPMILAGRISGVIATGERGGLEEMPPDIDDAIARIAAALAIALAAIETDRVRQENAALQARLAAAPA